jgi:hypothetical protein
MLERIKKLEENGIGESYIYMLNLNLANKIISPTSTYTTIEISCNYLVCLKLSLLLINSLKYAFHMMLIHLNYLRKVEKMLQHLKKILMVNPKKRKMYLVLPLKICFFFFFFKKKNFFLFRIFESIFITN